MDSNRRRLELKPLREDLPAFYREWQDMVLSGSRMAVFWPGRGGKATVIKKLRKEQGHDL